MSESSDPVAEGVDKFINLGLEFVRLLNKRAMLENEICAAQKVLFNFEPFLPDVMAQFKGSKSRSDERILALIASNPIVGPINEPDNKIFFDCVCRDPAF